jgi:hypothetical protein
MDTPVEIRRWTFDGTNRSETVIARGPFIIMIHGIAALVPPVRKECWIATPYGDITPDQAADALRAWSGKAA